MSAYRQPTLRDFFTILFRFKFQAISIFSFFVILSLVSAFFIEPSYTFSTKILVNARNSQPRLNVTDQPTRISIEELISTELDYIKSEIVLGNAITSYVANHPKSLLTIGNVESSLSVSSANNSSIITISFSSHDEIEARDLLNCIVNSYINSRAKNPFDSSDEISHFESLLGDINHRIDSLSSTMTESSFENNLVLSNDVKSYLSSELNSSLTKQQVVESEINSLEFEITSIKNELSTPNFQTIPSFLLDSDLQLRSLVEAAALISSNLENNTVFVDSSYVMLQLQDKLRLNNSAIGKRLNSILDYKQILMKDRVRERDALAGNVKSLQIDLSRNSVNSVTSNNLNSSMSDLLAVRTVLIRQLEEAKMRDNRYSTFALEIVDSVGRNSESDLPRTKLISSLIMLVGLIVSLVIPFYLNALSGVIFSELDASKATSLEVLSIINDCK